MSKHAIDAIKVARMIQKDNLSLLLRKSFVIVDNHDKIKKKPGGKMRKKYTLNQLGTNVDKLTTKVDQLTDELKELAKMVNDGFKHVNARIDKLETRIDQIDARLDYNNLKKLPKTIPSK